MILAHLADLHLGYRAYHRLASGGINARERDVAQAFRQAIDRMIELRVDLILVAGDVFHTVRPSNSAIADAFRQFARLRASLPNAPVVIIAGNHDSPRAVETGSILRLLAEIPGIHVMDEEARTVHIPELDTSILGVPHNALAGEARVEMRPDAAAGTNILMLHGTVTGSGLEQKLRFVSEYGGVLVDSSDIRWEQWDYVALGHYHLKEELTPRMWYAGGIERTSNNIWEEAAVEKGFLTFDTETQSTTFHELSTRAVIDLPRFSARRELDGEGGRYFAANEIDARIRALVEAMPGGIKDKIVRLVIEDVPRELFRELDHRQIRDYKAQALHFHLDARRPEIRRIVGYGAPATRRTLEEEVDNFLRRHWEPSSDQIQVERLMTLARRYLTEAARADGGDALVEAGLELS